jgi:anti-sigma factor RsiW
MTCDQIKKLINEMSAGELRELEPAVKEHIESCKSCMKMFTLRKISSESVAASSQKVQAGGDFKRRLLDALDGEPAPPTSAGSRRPFSWGVLLRPSPVWAAAALVLVLISGYNYLRTLGYFAPAGEMPATMGRFVDDVGHDAYLYSLQRQTFELVTQSPEDVRAWFSSRLDFAVQVPGDLSGGYTMQGIRLWHTVSRLSALVHYTDSQDRGVTLFVISASNLADHGGRPVERAGRNYHLGESFQYNAVAWQAQGTAYALVAQIPPEELLDIADSFSP